MVRDGTSSKGPRVVRRSSATVDAHHLTDHAKAHEAGFVVATLPELSAKLKLAIRNGYKT
jgi:hypothetical protein